ncbi:MAG: hypothetical protein HFI93_04975 [Lachnospiraceae bacterium]|nr:hypothetical protein [Lachnospiraceae bacterium]
MDEMDRILVEQAEAFVQEDKREEALGISPWESSISSILWGVLLISFHINLFGFPPEFVVNVLGFLLILRGFCRLTARSGWLKGGLFIALVTVISYEIRLVVSCTPLVLPGFLDKLLTAWLAGSRFLLFWLLYRGLPPFIENKEKRAEAAEKLKTALAYLSVNFVLILLGIFFAGSLFQWLLLALYLFFLYHILVELDETRSILQEYGYRLVPLNGRSVVLTRGLILILILFLVLGMPTAMHLSGKSDALPISEEIADGSDRIFYQVDPNELIDNGNFPADNPEDFLERYFTDFSAETTGFAPVALDPDKISKLRKELIAAGLPEEVVSALPASEILRYEGVAAVYPNTNILPEEENESPALCTAWLCSFEGTEVCRALIYGSWKEMPKGRYTDAIRFSFRNHVQDLTDFTGAVIGEENRTFFYSRMTAAGISFPHETLLITFPAPERGDRYDFYLGFQITPFISEDEKDPDILWHTALFPVQFYHREKLWCLPYQSPADTFPGEYGPFDGYKGNRIYPTSFYYSPFISFTTETP